MIERAVILCDEETFSVDEAWLQGKPSEVSGSVRSFPGDLAEVEKEFADRERKLIEAALAACHGRVSGDGGAAAKLGVAPQTLDSKIASLGIDKSQFKVRASKRRPA